MSATLATSSRWCETNPMQMPRSLRLLITLSKASTSRVFR